MHQHADHDDSELVTPVRATQSTDPAQQLGGPGVLLGLQRQAGNNAVKQLLAQRQSRTSSPAGTTVQRAPDQFTVDPGVMTGASKKLKGDEETIYYEWNWPVTLRGQRWLYNDWINANDPALEPILREPVIERLRAGHEENLQGIG